MNSRCEKLYSFYIKPGNADFFNWKEKLHTISIDSNKEQQALQNLFENETDTQLKIDLAEILSHFKNKKIKKFLLEIVNVAEVDGLQRYSALLSLIRLDYPVTVDQLEFYYKHREIGLMICRDLYIIHSDKSLEMLYEFVYERNPDLVPFLSSYQIEAIDRIKILKSKSFLYQLLARKQ